MQSRRPPGATVRIRDVLFLSLLVPAALAALQQQPAYRAGGYTDQDDRIAKSAAASEQRWRVAAADSLHTRDGEKSAVHPVAAAAAHYQHSQQHRDQFPEEDIHYTPPNKKYNARTTPVNQRALATVSPAGNVPAVRAPPAAKSPASSSAGLTSRRPARSLQDWQVEDIMLLATVDGKLHARDRRNGAPRWTLEVDREMVEIVNHRHPSPAGGETMMTFADGEDVDPDAGRDDPMFIVEPSQDGDIYIMIPGYGLQKLGYTVKQLAELAPYASQGYPPVAYTAEKKNTLYTVDAATGNILKSFSSAGSIVNEDRSCRRVSPFDSLDEKECDPIGTLTLGRTEYTIGIQDRNTGEPLNTIRYFEWGPNNHDIDLRNAYTATLDHRYVYSKFDGTVFGMDLAERTRAAVAPDGKALYRHKFPSPVVRVFDVVRETSDDAVAELAAGGDAALVVLPQPKGHHVLGDRSRNGGQDDDSLESVFINCTESGHWYALSESTYPMVTTGAADAKYHGGGDHLLPAVARHRDEFTGVHHLSANRGPVDPRTPLLDGSELRTIESPPRLPQEYEDYPGALPPLTDASRDGVISARFVAAILTAVLIAAGVFYRKPLSIPAWAQVLKLPGNSGTGSTAGDGTVLTTSNTSPEKATTAGATMVRAAEPAVETVFANDTTPPSSPPQVRFAESTKDAVTDGEREGESEEETAKDGTEPKKRKATRGKRGGRKQKEKQQAQAEARAKRVGQATGSSPPPGGDNGATEIISVADSENLEATAGHPLQINSLVIHTDKVIGQGGCGTMVFEGSWEGKAVAVKRMLSQYYELASQEVHFLQQSYHANVVRYFCQQKDNHFLYIAVELCQASLFEVWEADSANAGIGATNHRAKDPARQAQLQSLKLALQRDMRTALRQLAAGLCHLHTLRIIHRDIKPQNILVAYPLPPAKPGAIRLVISDFGLGKNLPENVSTLVDPTGNAGTSGWKAPELISQPREDAKVSSNSVHSTGDGANGNGGNGAAGVKRAADIFSLGCLFFWALTDGVHPFEDENGFMQMREVNIKRGKKNMAALAQWGGGAGSGGNDGFSTVGGGNNAGTTPAADGDASEALHLIAAMLAHQPEDRPTARQVLHHPYFWAPDRRLAFLCDCSDHFEREPRGTYEDGYAGDSYTLRLLEARAAEVIGGNGHDGDFLARLDRMFVETLGKQRKYSGNRLLDLLRALRNKKNHYEDMPYEVQRRVGALPGGYLEYWTRRFPRLLVVCFDVVREAELEESDRFRKYFEGDDG